MATTTGDPCKGSDLGTSTESFRQEVREFLADHAERVSTDLKLTVRERTRNFLSARYDAGLGAIDYPIEDGGRGLDRHYVDIYREEAAGLTEDSHFGIGLDMCMPTIRDHGNSQLRQRFLRPGLRGDERWCQLYSEPGAGSDLAGLTTRAVRDGDEWVVTGEKVWTSGAEDCDLGILLARTNWEVPKHAGISMLVLPLKQPGVEIRPLDQMTGVAHFNEVFMNQARLPVEWVVGGLGNGWQMAKALLAYERSSLGKGGGRQPIATKRLIDLARSSNRSTDPLIRQDLARLVSGGRITEWLNSRSEIHPSIPKLWRTRQGQAAAQLAAVLAFPGGVAWEGVRMGATEPQTSNNSEGAQWAYGICDSRALSLGGGTDEIQKNTLGERVLGLPREPAIDTKAPFSRVLKNPDQSSIQQG